MHATHRLVAQIFDAAIEVRGLSQQGGHVLRGRFVEIRPRPRGLLEGVLAVVCVAALAAGTVWHVVAVHFWNTRNRKRRCV